MCDCLVSMATHYAILENGDVLTKILKYDQNTCEVSKEPA